MPRTLAPFPTDDNGRAILPTNETVSPYYVPTTTPVTTLPGYHEHRDETWMGGRLETLILSLVAVLVVILVIFGMIILACRHYECGLFKRKVRGTGRALRLAQRRKAREEALRRHRDGSYLPPDEVMRRMRQMRESGQQQGKGGPANTPSTLSATYGRPAEPGKEDMSIEGGGGNAGGIEFDGIDVITANIDHHTSPSVARDATMIIDAHANPTGAEAPAATAKRHWWQFWVRSHRFNNNDGDDDDEFDSDEDDEEEDIVADPNGGGTADYRRARRANSTMTGGGARPRVPSGPTVTYGDANGNYDVSSAANDGGAAVSDAPPPYVEPASLQNGRGTFASAAPTPMGNASSMHEVGVAVAAPNRLDAPANAGGWASNVAAFFQHQPSSTAPTTTAHHHNTNNYHQPHQPYSNRTASVNINDLPAASGDDDGMGLIRAGRYPTTTANPNPIGGGAAFYGHNHHHNQQQPLPATHPQGPLSDDTPSSDSFGWSEPQQPVHSGGGARPIAAQQQQPQQQAVYYQQPQQPLAFQPTGITQHQQQLPYSGNHHRGGATTTRSFSSASASDDDDDDDEVRSVGSDEVDVYHKGNVMLPAYLFSGSGGNAKGNGGRRVGRSGDRGASAGLKSPSAANGSDGGVSLYGPMEFGGSSGHGSGGMGSGHGSGQHLQQGEGATPGGGSSHPHMRSVVLTTPPPFGGPMHPQQPQQHVAHSNQQQQSGGGYGLPPLHTVPPNNTNNATMPMNAYRPPQQGVIMGMPMATGGGVGMGTNNANGGVGTDYRIASWADEQLTVMRGNVVRPSPSHHYASSGGGNTNGSGYGSGSAGNDDSRPRFYSAGEGSGSGFGSDARPALGSAESFSSDSA